jgi:NitT/TauT family transport system ATP-binding protein
MLDVEINSLNKTYRGRDGQLVPVFRDFTLSVSGGTFTTVLGPNGSGKTTLLRILDGLDKDYEGLVRLGGEPPGEAPTAFIFQNYAESLYPWKNVLDNVAFPLEIAGFPRRERRARAARLLEELRLDLPASSFPYQLSGGQQQMVAIARGLTTNPALLLMDEPFGSLDYEVRYQLRERLLAIWRVRHPTVLFVSHEVDEAIYLADQVVVLSQRPARVSATIEVNLPRPREARMLEEEPFLGIKARVESAFRHALGSEPERAVSAGL